MGEEWIPKEYVNELRKQYERLIAGSKRNPCMTFAEFVLGILHLGAKRFEEIMERSPEGLVEYLKFFERE